MDVRCTKTYLQEIPIEVVTTECTKQEVRTILVCFDGVEASQLQTMFFALVDHFKGGRNRAELIWFGRREVPGHWVDRSDEMMVKTFIGIIQFVKPTAWINNLAYLLASWMTALQIPAETRNKVGRSMRTLTTCDCDDLSLCYRTPVVEVDPITKGALERIRQIWPPTNQKDSRELPSLMGEVDEWAQQTNLPDEIYDLPCPELCSTILELIAPDGTLKISTAPMLTTDVQLVEHRSVAICDAASTDLVVDGECVGELSEMLRKRRRVEEPFGYLFYTPTANDEVPILKVQKPKQRLRVGEVVKLIVHAYLHKHGCVTISHEECLLNIARVYRDLVDKGTCAQKDRMSLIAGFLEQAYRPLSGATLKFQSLPDDLKKKVQCIVLRNKCQTCEATFSPRDPVTYGSDATGTAVPVSTAAYDTIAFCSQRCCDRAGMFKCKCGRRMQPHPRMGWLGAKCPHCGPKTVFRYSFIEMDNLLAGLDRHHHVRRFLPSFS